MKPQLAEKMRKKYKDITRIYTTGGVIADIFELCDAVEEMQKTLIDIREQIPTMQDDEESESLRQNTGNMVLYLIDQALKGVSNE